MRRSRGTRLVSLALISAIVLGGSVAWGGSWGPWHHREQGPPCTMAELGAAIDAVEREIRASGTIVIKQPDVWGQDRRTAFRRDFDLRIRSDLDRFQPVLSAQVARSDLAAVSSEGGVGGTLSPTTPSAAATATATGTAAGTAPPVVVPPALPPMAAFAPVSPPTLAPVKVLAPGEPGLNLEPSIALDEKKQFLDHAYELLRVNHGDDTADAAGYGLYLFRMPISIDPGGPTCKGWGGLLSVTVRHEFGSSFVPETFRSLVVNDLVDLLAPMIVELIRTEGWRQRLNDFEAATFRYRQSNFAFKEHCDLFGCVQELKIPISPMRLWKGTYPIASGDMTNVLLVESFYRIAAEVQDRLRTSRPRGSEVRALLRQELEVAYDLMRGQEEHPGPLANINLIESITQLIVSRGFEGRPGDMPAFLAGHGMPAPEPNRLANAYRYLMTQLPGNLEQRALGSFCWAIAVDAGLLNRQLRQDMVRVDGMNTFVCPANLQSLFFYPPFVTPETDTAFCEYVKTRWPLVAFALDPVSDQQNIAEAYQRSRDMQMTLAGAFAAGRIGAHALSTLMRQVRYDADTIALNRTVTAFAHGPDTFGWRFYPRFQNPKGEPSTLHAFATFLVGSIDPAKTARLEPGQRELTAAIIVPSFLRSVRVETGSNWFKLGNTAAQRVDTPRMLELGRRVVALRQALGNTCDADQYRPNDLARLAARLDQLERLLPLQTHVLGLPYDHTLGGFELFTQGAMSLVPELVGYEGVEGIDPARVTDLLLLGKHFSLSGTRVLVSGVNVPEVEIDYISRRALRVRLPAQLPPTAVIYTGEATAPAYEVLLITPNGTSNRLVIPCVSASTLIPPEPAPTPAVSAGLTTPHQDTPPPAPPPGAASPHASPPPPPVQAPAPTPAPAGTPAAAPIPATAPAPAATPPPQQPPQPFELFIPQTRAKGSGKETIRR